jgi:hypothetical protein
LRNRGQTFEEIKSLLLLELDLMDGNLKIYEVGFGDMF